VDIVDAIINRLFSRTDCYARASTSKGKPSYTPSYYAGAGTPLLPLDRQVIEAHLRGTEIIGSYVLSTDRCRFAVIDVDVYDDDPIGTGWFAALAIHRALVSLGIPAESMLTELSGRKGWHVWTLFEDLAEASLVRRVLRAAVESIGFSIHGESRAERSGFPGHLEVFPKTDCASGEFGHLIKLPLGVHPVTRAKSVLYDAATGYQLPDEALLQVRPLALTALHTIAQSCPEKAPIQPGTKQQQAPKRIERLLPIDASEMCEHVQWMMRNVSSLSYEEWMNLGILLAQCDGGDQLFHSCSAEDERYDAPACDDLINNTRARSLNPPRCTTLGCSMNCGVRNPLEGQSRPYRRVHVPPQQPEEKPIDVCREELRALLEELLDNPKGMNLVVAPCGLGKTTQLLRLAQERELRVLTLAPDHGQAPHCLLAYQGIHLKSRRRLDEELEPGWCLHVEEIERLQRRNFSGSYAFCSNCGEVDSCPYMGMLQKAREAHHVVAVHAHLGRIDDRVLCNRDLIVVDEPIWSWHRREEKLAAKDVSDCRSAMQLLQSDNEIGDGAETLASYLAELLALRYGEIYTLPDRIDLDKGFIQTWEDCARRVVQGRNVLPDIVNASQHGTPIVCGDGFSYVHVSEFGDDIVVLDAFGDRELYERVTGREVTVWQPKSNPEQKIRVHQVLDGAYPNASLIPKEDGSRKTVLSEIERIRSRHPGREPAFICTKQFEAVLRERYPDADYLHFGALVGRDDFRDKPLVIRVGYQMLSYEDLVKNARVLLGLQWDDQAVLKELQESNKTWTLLDCSEGYEVRAWQPANEQVRMYYENVVLGEMRQGDGRCRPYAGEGDYYIICNLPTRLRVDEPIILRELRGTARQAVAEAVAAIPCGKEFVSTDLDTCYTDRTVRRELSKLDSIEKRDKRWVRVR